MIPKVAPASSPPGRTPPAIPFEIIALIVAIALPLLIHRSYGPGTQAGFGQNWEQLAIARAIVRGHGFANPYGDHVTGPTAAYAPVHPAMLAGILALVGDRPLAGIPMTLKEVAIQTACLILLLRISTILFATWIPGIFASAAMLICTRPLPQWENATAWLCMEIIFLCVLQKRGPPVTGLATGLGWLVSPSLVLVSISSIAIIRGWKTAAKTIAIACLIVTPWIVRNWTVFHAPFFLRDNFGLELFISNNDLAGPDQLEAPERYQLFHPSQNAAVAEELRRLGEPQYFSQLQSDAILWIRSHPGRFLRLTVARFALWWASNWPFAIVNLLGFAGMWMLSATAFGRATAVTLLLFPLPYYVIQFDPRYEWPVLWLSALTGGYVLWFILRRVSQSIRGRSTLSLFTRARPRNPFLT